MRLLGRTGQLAGRTVAVTGALRIGRAPENELQLSVDGVSRQHAQITPEGEAFWLEDLHSANGTYLNGVKLVARERLAHLDVITLGRLADLIVDARAASAPAAPAAVIAGDASLEAIDGPEGAAPIAIPAGEITIGRQVPAQVLIDSKVVSKLHARLRQSGDRLAIDDLDSPNGTFVNGARITTNHALRDGDTISIAGVRSYRVRISARAGTPPPVAAPAGAAATADASAAAAGPQPAFNQEWKTRLVWSPEELAAVEAERARVIEEVRRTTGALPGERATGGEVAQPPAAAARKTEFIGRDSLPIPPQFSGEAPPAAAPPPPAPAGAARKTEFIGRDSLDLPPNFVPPGEPSAAPAPAPRTAPPPPPSGQPGTSLFRSGADVPPVFADAPPIAPPAPAPSVADAPTVAVTPPRASVFCLRGALGEFALPEGTHIVGRQDGVAVHIVDRQVSRNHAAITVTNGQLTIEDHASANGTSVNGARVTAARALKVGDQVKFGDLLFTVAVKS